MFGPKVFAVPPVCDVDALIAGDGMRRDCRGWCNAVFPLLLHLGVHDEQGIMREVDGNLPRVVSGRGRWGRTVRIVFGDDFANPEFPLHPQAQTAYDGAGTKVGQLIGVIADMLGASIIAVHERGIGLPRFGRLVLEFLAVGVEVADASGDLFVDGVADAVADLAHDGQDLPDIAQVIAVVVVLAPLALNVGQTVHVEACGVRRLDNIVEDLEADALVAGDFGEDFL